VRGAKVKTSIVSDETIAVGVPEIPLFKDSKTQQQEGFVLKICLYLHGQLALFF
jgi:hypothetical protein